MIRIVVCGAAGRMGRQLVSLIAGSGDLTLAGAIEYPSHPDLGKDAGELAGAGTLGVRLTAPLRQTLPGADVVVDFSHADVTREVIAAVAEAGKALVIGTTGHPAAQREALVRAAAGIPVVWAPNMAVGVTLLFRLAEEAARILGEDYDVEVVETHHRQKKDAPSGTALRLAEGVARARGRDLSRDGVFARHGMVGGRPPGAIGVQALRGGDVVGDHSVLFLGEGERIELVHRAVSREIFARGALRAARWVLSRKPGLYDMFDVLGIK